MSHHYTVWLDYHNLSSVGSSHDTLEKAKERLAEYIAYYSGPNCNYDYQEFKFSIEKVCSNCEGRGEIFIPNKRTPRIGKHKRCPICKGKNSRVTIL